MAYLKDQVYEELRNRIIEYKYAPGTTVNETMLMKELGVSRTPVREALHRLEIENLVTIIPKKGVIIKGISIDDILQVFDARIVIEPQIIVMYGSRFPKDTLRKYLDDCHKAATVEEIIRLDEYFHNALYQLCANHYLREALLMIEGHNHRNRIWRSNENRVSASLQEHINIAEALLEENYELAGVRMREHLSVAREYALRKYL